MRIAVKLAAFRTTFIVLGTSKNSFLLRTAAISIGGVVRPKFVLDITLAMPAANLTFRLAEENFARSRDKSNF
jgi:hypothetical protein